SSFPLFSLHPRKGGQKGGAVNVSPSPAAASAKRKQPHPLLCPVATLGAQFRRFSFPEGVIRRRWLGLSFCPFSRSPGFGRQHRLRYRRTRSPECFCTPATGTARRTPGAAPR